MGHKIVGTDDGTQCYACGQTWADGLDADSFVCDPSAVCVDGFAHVWLRFPDYMAECGLCFHVVRDAWENARVARDYMAGAEL
jgi:hypothetical protein